MNRVVYLHGFASSPQSQKVAFFRQRFTQLGVPFAAPDLDAGDFEHLTLSGQLRVIAGACGEEPVTLMGSSMGGYLAALYAARHPSVTQLVLLAPAFSFGRTFTEIIGPERLNAWRQDGSVRIFHYGDGRERNLSYGLLEDAARYEDFPEVRQRTLIFHGVHDTSVPARLSETFAAGRANVDLRLLDSDHQLGNVLETMWDETSTFLK